MDKELHVLGTKGQWYGHLFRRLVHVSLLVIPLLYYAYGKQIAVFFHLTAVNLLLILLGLVIVAELIRLRLGFIFFGQRKHERHCVSSFSWGACGILVVLLFSPGREFSIPIIWSLALGDPLLGELRHIISLTWLIWLIGIIFIAMIWWGCAYWFGISLWWGVLLAPVTVAVEWLNLKWIDDNVLMLLVPLAIVLILI